MTDTDDVKKVQHISDLNRMMRFVREMLDDYDAMIHDAPNRFDERFKRALTEMLAYFINTL